MNLDDQSEETFINYEESNTEESDHEDEEEDDVNNTDPFIKKIVDTAKDSSDSDSESDLWMKPWHEVYSWKSVKYLEIFDPIWRWSHGN